MRSIVVKRILNISLATKMLKNRLLCIFLPKMSAYRKDFDETKYMSFYDRKMMNYLKNIMKFGKKLKIVSKKISIVNLYTMKNI